MARLQIARYHSLNDVDQAAAAVALLSHVRDPRIRTSFGNICGYIRVLQGRYEEAASTAATALADAEQYQLTFTFPHLRMTYAAAAFGVRNFSLADSLLRSVEENATMHADLHNELNARALRARILLAQNRSNEALEVVRLSWEAAPAMTYGEYVATRALALAVGDNHRGALEEASMARSLTGIVEVKAAALAAEAVAHLGRATSSADEALFEFASAADVWDPVIVAMRAHPPLLEKLARDPHKHEVLSRVLTRSHDASLARRCGVPLASPYNRAILLSKREQEVIDLIAQGFTNKEIARMLFIEVSTAKVHVRHILEKLNVRRRAEAVARYAEIAEAMRKSGTDDAGSSGISLS